MRYQHGHSTILSNLEPLLLSGLESKHRAIANAAIRLWNATFADCEDNLEYPPRIQAALLRLRRVADLQLPFFPESAESEISEDHRQPLTFDDTQDDSTSYLEPSKRDSILESEPVPALGSSKSLNLTPQALIRGRLPPQGLNKRSREETPEIGFRFSKKRVPTPKLRHDDSQIQFEAVDSSPVPEETLESQLLTDRQKEVKERQKFEAAMFPDLRSSPRPKGPSSTEELPLHRSSSKSQSMPSPSLARQTTPTLILQAEEDDFVNSSPTPSRANTSEPPSSSVGELTKKQDATYDEESDIPSSPPEIVDDQSNVNTTPLYPSAQVDPYAVETARPVSTYEDTPDESIEHEQSSTLEVRLKSKRITRQSTPEATSGRADQSSNSSQLAVDTSMIDNKPQEGDDDSAAAEQARAASVFHDALTSPASSDGHTANTEVFQDAVSSPQLDTKKSSSPDSDFDESSMLRLVKEYDQGSGRPRRSVRFSGGKENQPTEPMDPTESPHPVASSTSFVDETMDNIHRPNPSSSKGSESSSFPSLIPETPGIKGNKIFTEEGEELDPDETIFVVSPADSEPYTASRRWRGRAIFTPVRNWSAKKRKHEEADGGEREVPDSQDFKVEGRMNNALKIKFRRC